MKRKPQVIPPIERFRWYFRINLVTDCWNWIGAKNRGGYGYFYADKRLIAAHRFSWEILYGPIPENLFCLHRCDNPACVNPSHLFLGTLQDNRRDCVSKNRQAKGSETNKSSLTDKDIVDIRRLKNTFTFAELGDIYDVSSEAIWSICHRKSWKHI